MVLDRKRPGQWGYGVKYRIGTPEGMDVHTTRPTNAKAKPITRMALVFIYIWSLSWYFFLGLFSAYLQPLLCFPY